MRLKTVLENVEIRSLPYPAPYASNLDDKNIIVQKRGRYFHNKLLEVLCLESSN